MKTHPASFCRCIPPSLASSVFEFTHLPKQLSSLIHGLFQHELPLKDSQQITPITGNEENCNDSSFLGFEEPHLGDHGRVISSLPFFEPFFPQISGTISCTAVMDFAGFL